MSNEAIERIKMCEAEAASVVAKAKRTASENLASARAAAQAVIDKAAADSSEYAGKAAELAKKKSADIIDSERDSARLEAKKMVSAADANMKAAVNTVIRGIFEKWQ